VDARAASFRPIFEGEFAYVWNTLRRLGVRPEDLEDVTHEVFLRLFRRLGDYDPGRPLRSWVFGFAYRCASDYRRLARHRREVASTSGRDPDDLPDTGPSPEERLDAGDRRAFLERALDALPLERRALFVLHELEERPVSEIAATLGVPVDTAWSRLRTAREEFGAAVKRLRLRQREVT
jgi:RNA polymerase sigma-70 factor (ECF subfamily)